MWIILQLKTHLTLKNGKWTKLTSIQTLKHNLQCTESEIIHRKQIIRKKILLSSERNSRGIFNLPHSFKNKSFKSLINNKTKQIRQISSIKLN